MRRRCIRGWPWVERAAVAGRRALALHPRRARRALRPRARPGETRDRRGHGDGGRRAPAARRSRRATRCTPGAEAVPARGRGAPGRARVRRARGAGRRRPGAAARSRDGLPVLREFQAAVRLPTEAGWPTREAALRRPARASPGSSRRA
jgi:hypothetical protein